jgi:hypothetical protein
MNGSRTYSRLSEVSSLKAITHSMPVLTGEQMAGLRAQRRVQASQQLIGFNTMDVLPSRKQFDLHGEAFEIVEADRRHVYAAPHAARRFRAN